MVLDSVVRDVRYAMRGLRRSPGFLATAVLTLGLGIGATATMYSVVYDVLLAPLPYPDRDRLVGVAFTFPQEKPNAEQSGAGADFVRDHTSSFASFGVAEDASTGANLSGVGGGERALRVASTKASQGYFPTLGVQPLLGRTFTAEEDLPGGPNVALLSAKVWKSDFNSDPAVINRVVRINEEPYTVVGVMPASAIGSAEEQGGTGSVGVWLPLRLNVKDPGYDGDNYTMVARLKPGATLVQAQQELTGLKDPFYKQFPQYLSWMTRGKQVHEFRVWPLQTVLVSDVRQSLLVLMAAVAAVLLVACLNLAGLMTARAATRQRELALRTALGATRNGLLRLMLCESLVLAVAGGGLGVAIARVAKPALLAAAPIGIPATGHGGWLGVAGFIALVALGTILVCGLLPAWGALRQDAQSGLKGGQGAGANVAQVRLGKGLMVGQVAVAMVLLSAASLLLGSFLKLRSAPSGLETKRVTVAQVALKGNAYFTNASTTQFVEKVVASLGSYPGVERVAAVNGLPLDRGLNVGGGPVDQPEIKGIVEFRAITPEYFRTLGVPVLMGRDVSATDRAGAQRVVLVNETAAKKWWPGKSAIGERVRVGGKNEPERMVVGVVADTKTRSLAENAQAMVYAPFGQMSDGLTKIVNGWFPTSFVVKTAADVDIASAVAGAVNAADAEMPVARLTTMQDVVDRTISGPKFFSWMAGGFAAFALLLTVIGLFGLLSYQVTQRTREIGVRMAIGAGRGEILRLILGRGLSLTAIGLAAGGLMSLAVPRLVSSVLSDVVYVPGAQIGTVLGSSTTALGVAAIAMLMAAGMASFLPARRAAATEPVEALRAE